MMNKGVTAAAHGIAASLGLLFAFSAGVNKNHWISIPLILIAVICIIAAGHQQ